VKQVERQFMRVLDPTASLAEAIFPDKELWKSEPGNRYTADELQQMDRNWDIQIIRPKLTQSRSVD
jgi:hypothetical protein